MAVLHFSGAHLVPVALAFALLGAGFLVTTSKEVAFGALQLWFRTIFAEMTFLLTVKAFIFASCLYGINVHGVRVFLLDLFCRSFLNETKELFSGSCLPKIGCECV